MPKNSKPAKKLAGQRYTYNSLASVSTHDDKQDKHIYGVIIDATFPYKVSKNKFVCSLKVVDSSLNGQGKKNEYASIVLYASRFEDLPIVSRVGDIIRVHRASLRLYDDKRQFNVNCQFHGSWALFATDKSVNEDMSHSGRHCTFEKAEVSLLAALRKWASSYFSSNDGVTKDMYTALSKAKNEKSDFDVVAKITQCRDFDEYTNELRLTDASGSSWYTLATKLKFSGVRDGQVVRIRSVTHDSSSSKAVLAQSHFSNIMSFLPGSKLAASLSKVNHTAKDMDCCAQVLTQVGAKYAGMPTTSLRDLFHNGGVSAGKGPFRVMLQVLAVQPGDVKEMTKANNGGKMASAKGAKGNLCWNAQLICKDASTANGDNQYKVLNYSHDGLGANFFGKAQDMHSNAKARADTEAKVKAMTTFNRYVDAVVEKVGGFYHVRDTTFKN
jgi:hypothetical protein